MLVKEPPLYDLRCAIVRAVSQDGPVPTLNLVRRNTFPPVEEGHDSHGVAWTHPTILPDKVTEPDVARKFEPLWNANRSIMDVRLDKLTDPHAEESLAIVRRAATSSDHPDHWSSTLDWIATIRAYSNGTSFSAMSETDKMCFRVYALMTGSSNGSLHADFQKSENILDFVEKGESESAVVSMMNSRRDERVYMVPQVARAMARNAVTDRRTISLSWNAPDDLDLHVMTPNGSHIFYANAKRVIDGLMLNFDANACDCVSEPVENVSVLRNPGSDVFRIYVNNYNDRSLSDVPFQVVIMEEGRPDVVHHGVWHATRGGNASNTLSRMLCVATHVFAGEGNTTVAMTDKERARALANASLWDANMGTPTSRVAHLRDATECNRVVHMLPSSVTIPKTTTSKQLNDEFMAMALGGGDPVAKKRTYLSDRCAPTTLMHVVQRALRSSTPLYVRVHDVSPGYIVCIENTKTPVVFDKMQPCHYRDQGHPPMVPTSRGNARSCGEWFEDNRYETSMARVVAVVTKEGSTPFLVLEGARLPSVDSTSFPRGAGFYSTSLRPDFHVLRDRWCTHHTRLALDEPTDSTSSPPLIGGFVCSGENVFYMNDTRIAVTM